MLDLVYLFAALAVLVILIRGGLQFAVWCYQIIEGAIASLRSLYRFLAHD